ncbi:MAG: hypothetical protein ABI583_15630 [Betaproteobacteria bacterium]
MRVAIQVAVGLLTLVVGLATSLAEAQILPADAVVFTPPQPTSADSIFLKIPRTCANSNYVGPGYRVSTASGRIRLDISLGPPPPCAVGLPPAPSLLVEIGRVPAGQYTLDIVEARLFSFEVVFATIASNLSLVVADHRAAKTAPAVRLNYSDHWWDPSNPGSGLFIWQNATDQLLAAWFTYGADGKAVWYTLQAGTWVSATRYEGKLVETGRAPNVILGGLIDGTGATNVQVIGSASLDFAGEDGVNAGVFTYNFDNAPGPRSRNIRRFGK